MPPLLNRKNRAQRKYCEKWMSKLRQSPASKCAVIAALACQDQQ
jgi:hypothetical protein